MKRKRRNSQSKICIKKLISSEEREEILNLKSGLMYPSWVTSPTHPAREIKLELDGVTTAVKEAGNQPKLSATSLVSRSVSSLKELFEVSRLCQAYKRVSREDRNQKEKGEILGLSLTLWTVHCSNITLQCARQLSVQLDKLDLIPRDQTLSHRNTELIDINIHTILFTTTYSYAQFFI